MRLAALLLALTALGCSDPAPADPGPWHYTRDSALEQADDAGAAADTATPPADTSTPAADTYTPPPADTSPPCRPHIALDVCLRTAPIELACGTRPDGCGGIVACDPCTGPRQCVESPTVPPHCACAVIYGPWCATKSGAAGRTWECRLDEVPLHPDARMLPQPDGTVTRWCVGP